jgi:phosphatidylinositol alpha-1,6-mannosyltransferase
LLVTNDFPPKIGGIQSYLFELWRRLPPSETTVFTTNYAGDKKWDAVRRFRVVRAKESQFFPTRSLANRIDSLAREVGADVIFLDPWLPLGQLGPRLRAAPYVVVVHGAEVTVPGRLPHHRRSRGRAAGVAAKASAPRCGSGAHSRAWSSRRAWTSIDSDRSTPPRKIAVAAFARRAAAGRRDDRLVPERLRHLIDAVAALPDVRSPVPAAAKPPAAERRKHHLGSRRGFGRVPTVRWRHCSRAPTCLRCRDRWLVARRSIVFLGGAGGPWLRDEAADRRL